MSFLIISVFIPSKTGVDLNYLLLFTSYINICVSKCTKYKYNTHVTSAKLDSPAFYFPHLSLYLPSAFINGRLLTGVGAAGVPLGHQVLKWL